MLAFSPTSVIAATAFTFCAPAAVCAQEKVTYDDDIQRLVMQNCGKCHGSERMKASLDLTTYAGVMKGSSGGPVVQSGAPDESVIYLAVTHQREPTMPPGNGKIADATIAKLRQWIEGGLLENSGSQAKARKKSGFDLKAAPVSAGRPAEPLPLPVHLPLEPATVTARPGAVMALAANPWSSLLALGGQKQILLYDARSLEPIGVLPFQEGLANALSFSRDGRLLVAGGGHAGASGRVVVWDLASGRRLIEAGDETDAVLAADLSADRTRVALGGSDRVVKLIATDSGVTVHTLRKHTDWITAAGFSPDGVLLASGDRNGGLVVWETFAGREMHTLTGHTGAITGVAWRDDSNVLASVSEDGTVRLWEMFEGKAVKSWPAHAGGALAVAFAHDGRLATAGRDKVVKLWSADGQALKNFEPMADLALEVAFDDEGTRVIGGDAQGNVVVWNAADGARLGSLVLNPPRIADRLTVARQRLVERSAEADAAAQRLAAAEGPAAEPLAKLADARTGEAIASQAVTAAEAALQTARAAAEAAAAALTAAAQELEARRVEAEARAQAIAAAEAESATATTALERAVRAVGDRRALAQRLEEAAAAAAAVAETAPEDAALHEAAARAAEAVVQGHASLATAEQARTTLDERTVALAQTLVTARAAAAEGASAIGAATTRRDEQSARNAAEAQRQSLAEAALAAARGELEQRGALVAPLAEAAHTFESTLAEARAAATAADQARAAARHEVVRWEAAEQDVQIAAARIELASAEEQRETRRGAVAEATAANDAAAAKVAAEEAQLAASPQTRQQLEQATAAARLAVDSANSAVEAARAAADEKRRFAAVVEALRADLVARAEKDPTSATLGQAATKMGEVLESLRADLQRADETISQRGAIAAEAVAMVDQTLAAIDAHDRAMALLPATIETLRAAAAATASTKAAAEAELAAAEQLCADITQRIATLERDRDAHLAAD